MSTRPERSTGRGALKRGSALGLALVGLGLVLSSVSGPEASYPPGGSPPQAQLVGREALTVAPAVRFEPAEQKRAELKKQPRRTEPADPPRRRRLPAGAPQRLVIPTLGVDAPVIGISTSDGVLLPPGDPQTLGWWSAGAKPGAKFGGALITGHTVHSGGGAFDDLETLAAGDQVRVRTTRGVLRYTVSDVTIYRKASLAEHAQEVFSQSVPGRLVLVTCEDWNGATYLSNAVVLADPVG